MIIIKYILFLCKLVAKFVDCWKSNFLKWREKGFWTLNKNSRTEVFMYHCSLQQQRGLGSSHLDLTDNIDSMYSNIAGRESVASDKLRCELEIELGNFPTKRQLSCIGLVYPCLCLSHNIYYVKGRKKYRNI